MLWTSPSAALPCSMLGSWVPPEGAGVASSVVRSAKEPRTAPLHRHAGTGALLAVSACGRLAQRRARRKLHKHIAARSWEYQCRQDRSTTSCAASQRQVAIDPEIYKVELQKRSYYLEQCPEESLYRPEICVFGRSNVGKSSLINFLCKRKLLSTISKRPGHTKLIHHFLVDQSWYLVDLPGIGHAEGGRKILRSMDRMVTQYIEKRSTIARILYLVDAHIPPVPIDLASLKYFGDSKVPLSIVFTKTDKPPMGKMHPEGPAEGLIEALLALPGSPWRDSSELPQMLMTSSAARTGRDPLLQHLADCRQNHVDKIREARKAFFDEMKKARSQHVAEGPPPAVR